MFLRHRQNSSSNRYRERGFFFLGAREKMFVQSKATKGSEFRAKFPAFNGSLQRPRFAVNEESLSIRLRITELRLFLQKNYWESYTKSARRSRQTIITLL